MKLFKINDKIEIVCNYENTRNGFRHRATLLLNGNDVDMTTEHYLNRTWESYEYQSVMYKLVRKTKVLTDEEKEIANKFIEKGREDLSDVKTTLMVAKIGDLFCNTQKEKNDWKVRMLKAGLEHKGLSIPKDWDKLSEEEKEKRLNKVIDECGDKNGKTKS
jgi:hypothetical protein